jgi:Zn-dependent oligopeptidase
VEGIGLAYFFLQRIFSGISQGSGIIFVKKSLERKNSERFFPDNIFFKKFSENFTRAGDFSGNYFDRVSHS